MESAQSAQKGHYHPLTLVVRDFEAIFREMGFSVVLGPEMDTEHYNFNMLNVPPDHPARDMQDTFWVKGREHMVMRTQTSNMQIRYMETHKPPIRIIAPGRVYRAEKADARHQVIFHQIEGLAIDTDLTLGHLKWTLQTMFQKILYKDAEIRFRPGYFPFVEPGFEVDVSCFKCAKEKSCPLCKGTGWIEVVPAGMVHPKVLSNVGIDPKKYQGFAFGAGAERLAMVRYGIEDGRIFSSGDLRLTAQF